MSWHGTVQIWTFNTSIIITTSLAYSCPKLLQKENKGRREYNQGNHVYLFNIYCISTIHCLVLSVEYTMGDKMDTVMVFFLMV